MMVKITVLGCGLMGIKIAGELAYYGHRVKIFDSNVHMLNSAYHRIEEDKKCLREDGLLPQANFVGQILCLSQIEEAVRDAEFILEAVVDDLEVKQELFERTSMYCRSDAILATNTLRLDISAVAERVINKERTLGLRFLYPVYYIPEVEITPNRYTSNDTVEKVRTLLEKMGKTLFFRSGGEPLILSEEQRESRKFARLEAVRNTSVGHPNFFESSIPALSHRGNMPPPQDDDYGPNSDGDRDCAICMDRSRDSLLCPCHHMVTCCECAKSLLNRRDGCPICRKTITEIIRVYHS